MAILYCSSTGSNTAPYSTWATAATTLATATGAAAAGDTVYISNTQSEALLASTTYTMAGTSSAPVYIISTNDTVNMPPTTIAVGAKIAVSGAGAFSIGIQSGQSYWFGVEFDTSTSASSAINISTLGVGTTEFTSFNSCTFKSLRAVSGNWLTLGGYGTTIPSYVKTSNCTFISGNNAGATVTARGMWHDFNGTFLHTTTQPTTFFAGGSGVMRFLGSDFSDITTTLFAAHTIATDIYIDECILASGATVIATQTTAASAQVFLTDSAFGNIHYTFAHYNYFGSTVAQTTIYENQQSTGDGAYYDGSSDPIAWTITGVNGSYGTPYYSPWIDVYNENLTAVTPRLEIARNGSATAFNNDEVFAEFVVKKTAGSTLGTLDNSSKRAWLAASAAQPNSAKTIANWTGLSATYWLGVLQPTATITPAVPGYIRTRVGVIGAKTVYVNPRILGI